MNGSDNQHDDHSIRPFGKKYEDELVLISEERLPPIIKTVDDYDRFKKITGETLIHRYKNIFGIALLSIVAVSCTFILLNGNYADKITEEAVKLLYLIIGAIVAFIYANPGKH